MTNPNSTKCKILTFPKKQQESVHENTDPERLQALLDSFDYCEYIPVGESPRLAKPAQASVMPLHPDKKK